MTERSLNLQTDQVAAIVREFIRLKPRLKIVLPEDLARVKQRLSELHPEGGVSRAADHDLFFRIGIVLTHHREPLTMGELSEKLDVPLSTATRMVDWMVESGYLERLADPEDRRIVRVALTETGRQLYQTINEFVKHRVELLLRRFTPEDREDLVVLLGKAAKALEEMEG